MHKLLLVALVSGLAWPAQTSTQTPAPGGTQADLANGIRQVEEGDLEAAVITLDTVIQRLKQEKGREKDLGTAHLYLAMAHLGLSQGERAKGEMREAWRNNPQLVLDPKKFPPRVIQLYEQTRQENKPAQAPAEQAKQAQKAPSPAAVPRAATAAPAKRKGGGSKAVLIGLGIAAVGGGVAAAAGGGGSSPPAAAPTPTSTLPAEMTVTVTSTDVPKIYSGSGVFSDLIIPNAGTVISAGVSMTHDGLNFVRRQLNHANAQANLGDCYNCCNGTCTSGFGSEGAEMMKFVGTESSGVWRFYLLPVGSAPTGRLQSWTVTVKLRPR